MFNQLETGHYNNSDDRKQAVQLVHETCWMCKKLTDGVYHNLDGVCTVITRLGVAYKELLPWPWPVCGRKGYKNWIGGTTLDETYQEKNPTTQ